YLRIASPAAAEDLRRALPDFLDRRLPPPQGAFSRRARDVSSLQLLPITDIHLHPAGLSPMKPAGSIDVLWAASAVAALILLVAGINFVNLMTARASRRALEVGVRKAVGAKRVQLIVQFLAESLIYAGLAMIVAVALARELLPYLNALLSR